MANAKRKAPVGARTRLTIEEFERRAKEIEQAERAALGDVVEHLRDLAVHLPEGSRLALRFAMTAKKVESIVSGSNPGLWGATALDNGVSEWGDA